jgi:hypothetical protein
MHSIASRITALSLILSSCMPLGCSHPLPSDAPGGGTGGHAATSTVASSTSAGTGGANLTGGAGGTGGTAGGIGAGTGGADAGGAAPVTDLYVDPAAGADTNPGTHEAPFKTLSHALSVATNGQSVHLASGTYQASGGESFPEEVPDGVTVDTAAAGDATLLGQQDPVGVHFAGSGTLRLVQIQGFTAAVQAEAGAQTLDTLAFVDDGCAVSLTGAPDAPAYAQATLTDCTIAGGSSAFALDGAASLTMTGGAIHDLGPACQMGVAVGAASGASSVTLDGVDVYTVGGPLALGEAAQATIHASSFANVGGGGCGSASIEVAGAASLSVDGTSVSNPPANAVFVQSSGATVALTSTMIEATVFGINVEADATVTLDGLTLSGPGGSTTTWGVYVSSPSAHVTLTNATVGGFYRGVAVAEGALKVRGSTIGNGVSGVWFGGGSVDLGDSASDPGGNVLQANTVAALDIEPAAPATVHAVGNTWLPNVQGADATGRYAAGTTQGPLATNAPAPVNFRIVDASKVAH